MLSDSHLSGVWIAILEKKLPIVRALAKMTAERMKTMREARFRNTTIFLTRYCPQKPARSETDIRYKAAKFFSNHQTRSNYTRAQMKTQNVMWRVILSNILIKCGLKHLFIWRTKFPVSGNKEWAIVSRTRFSFSLHCQINAIHVGNTSPVRKVSLK